MTVQPGTPDDLTKPTEPVNPEAAPPVPPADKPADEPKPEAPEYMTKADFDAAMDKWKADQEAAAAEAAKRQAPAPAPKPKAETAPAGTDTPPPATTPEEPSYGSKTWFKR